jgi:hypothetical protein
LTTSAILSPHETLTTEQTLLTPALTVQVPVEQVAKIPDWSFFFLSASSSTRSIDLTVIPPQAREKSGRGITAPEGVIVISPEAWGRGPRT